MHGSSPRLRWAFFLIGLLAALAGMPQPIAQAQATVSQPDARADASAISEFGKLFDAVVETTAKSFWDKERLAGLGWLGLAAEARREIVEAPSLEEAARRINALLAKLETSHTALLTQDDVDYYVLLSVFGGGSMPQSEFDDLFWGAGVTYPGIGHFTVRIDGRDFVDLLLEGSPAARAGVRVGDEIVSIDGAPHHQIRSFRGKIGSKVSVTIRRARDGPTQTLPIKVMAIAPLHAFGEATRASARVIARDGRRIGYVHVWASVGEESGNALRSALSSLGVNLRPSHSGGGKGESDREPPLDGLIIDMRGKIGGTANMAARYLDLLDPRGPLLGSRDRSKASRATTAVRGRTAVLIDHHTRSTAELFVHAYKRERQGLLVGTRTAGAVTAASSFIMPGNNLLYLAVSGLEIDGEVLEGAGVAPDIEVVRPLPYAQGADPVVDAAADVLAAKADARDAADREQRRPGR